MAFLYRFTLAVFVILLILSVLGALYDILQQARRFPRSIWAWARSSRSRGTWLTFAAGLCRTHI
jgi:hypothetical protein